MSSLYNMIYGSGRFKSNSESDDVDVQSTLHVHNNIDQRRDGNNVDVESTQKEQKRKRIDDDVDNDDGGGFQQSRLKVPKFEDTNISHFKTKNEEVQIDSSEEYPSDDSSGEVESIGTHSSGSTGGNKRKKCKRNVVHSLELAKQRLTYMYDSIVDSENIYRETNNSKHRTATNIHRPAADEASSICKQNDQQHRRTATLELDGENTDSREQLSNDEQLHMKTDASIEASQSDNNPLTLRSRHSYGINGDDCDENIPFDELINENLKGNRDGNYYYYRSGWLHNTSHRSRKSNKRLEFSKRRDGESIEEHALRLRQTIATTEYANIRKQFRKRKYKFSEESDAIDIGNAISNKVTAAMEHFESIKKNDDILKARTDYDKRIRLKVDVDSKVNDESFLQQQGRTHIEINPNEYRNEIETAGFFNETYDPLDHIYNRIKLDNEAAHKKSQELMHAKNSNAPWDDENNFFDHTKSGNWKALLNLDDFARGKLSRHTKTNPYRTRLLKNAEDDNDKDIQDDSDQIAKKMALYWSFQREQHSLRKHCDAKSSQKPTEQGINNNDKIGEVDEIRSNDYFQNISSNLESHNDYVKLKSLPKINNKTPFRISYHQHVFPLYSYRTYGPYEHCRNVVRLAGRSVFTATDDQIITLRSNDIKRKNSISSENTVDSASMDQTSTIMDRQLHFLWHKSLNDGTPYHRIQCVLNHAKITGLSLRCFYNYSWKDRQKASVALGVAGPHIAGHLFQAVGSENEVGKRLFTNATVQNRVEEQQRIVKVLANRNLTTGKPEEIPWFKPVPRNDKQEGDENDSIKWIRNQDEENKEIVQEFLQYFNVNHCFYMPRYVTEEWFPIHTSYRYVQGTSPPIPGAPLDEVGIIFGPEHPYDLIFVHGTIPEVTMKITVSALISKMVQHSNVASHVQKQLESVMATAVKQNRRDLIKMFRSITKPLRQLPLSCWYHTLMEYCSLLCNGFMKFPREVSDDSSSVGQDRPFAEDDNSHEWEVISLNEDSNVIAKDVVSFLEDLIDHNGLRMFPRIHAVYGITQIAAVLPASAAEILMRHVDISSNRTPFSVLRDLLEHLENAGALGLGLKYNPNNTLVECSTLQNVMKNVARRLTKQCENNPNDLECLCWLIGTFASCVLLTSGNRIGSGARCFPSTLTKADTNKVSSDALIKTERQSLVDHEIRYMLPSFHQHKRDTLRAFQLLLHLCRRQAGIRVHNAVTSFLEWSEVIALLNGPSKNEENKRRTYESICRLHNYHSTGWMLREDCESKANLISDKDRNVRLHALASILENSPDNKAHWIALVRELGHINKTVRNFDSEPHSHNRGGTIDYLDNESCTVPEVESKTFDAEEKPFYKRWWGEDRQWWRDTLLRASVRDAILPSPSLFKKPVLLKLLKARFRKLKTPQPSVDLKFEPDLDPLCLEWIDEAIRKSEYVHFDRLASPLEREVRIDTYLPKPFKKKRKVHESKIDVTGFEFTGFETEAYIMLCYKTLILSHLTSLIHPDVLSTIEQLLFRAWEKKTLREDTNAYKALLWLHSMGIDIPRAVRHMSFLGNKSKYNK